MPRFELPANKRFTNEVRIPIRWGDMDAMGHLNNTLYFRYLEIVRIAWFDEMGCGPNPAGEGPVIVNAFCNFIKQLEYPGDVIARHFAGEVGRSSVETFVTLERVDQPGTLYAEGGAKLVWVDFPSQRAVPLPDWLRARVGA